MGFYSEKPYVVYLKYPHCCNVTVHTRQTLLTKITMLTQRIRVIHVKLNAPTYFHICPCGAVGCLSPGNMKNAVDDIWIRR